MDESASGFEVLALAAKQMKERKQTATKQLSKTLSSVKLPVPNDIIREAYLSADFAAFDAHPGYPEFVHRRAYARADRTLMSSIDELLILALQISDQPPQALGFGEKKDDIFDFSGRFSLRLFTFCHCVASVEDMIDNLSALERWSFFGRGESSHIAQTIDMQMFFKSFRNLAHHVTRTEPNIGYMRAFTRNVAMATVNLNLQEIESVLRQSGDRISINQKTKSSLMKCLRELPESIDLIEQVKIYKSQYVDYRTVYLEPVLSKCSAELADYRRCRERFARIAKHAQLTIIAKATGRR